MKYCLVGNSHNYQFLSVHSTIIEELHLKGASIKGLVNPNSKLQLKEKISKYKMENPDRVLVYFLGQVDVEFGYYYKSVIDNKKYDINDYIDGLLRLYDEYLQKETGKFILLGINPTVINDIRHNYHVSFRDINGKEGGYSDIRNDISFEENTHIYNDNYDTRYNNNKLFNQKLKRLCESKGYKYIDLWDIVTENNKVRKEYYPDGLDHHLIQHVDLYNGLINKLENVQW